MPGNGHQKQQGRLGHQPAFRIRALPMAIQRAVEVPTMASAAVGQGSRSGRSRVTLTGRYGAGVLGGI